MEMEAFAESIPVASISDNFFFESSEEGDVFVPHNNFKDEGQASARYLIGYPVRSIKAHIRPQGKLKVKNFLTTTSEAATKIVTNALDQTVSMNFPRGDSSGSEIIEVTNDTEETFNYFVDIAPQRSAMERCILWNKLSSAEATSTSEVGPAASVLKRESYFPREYNYALEAPSYVLDPFWLLNNNLQSYISYDLGATWETRGNILTDYNVNTFLTNESPQASSFLFTYILIDLGQVHSLESVETFRPSGRDLFEGPLYSSLDIDDPASLDLINDFGSPQEQVRWIRFRAFSRDVGTAASELNYVSYVRLSLDVLDARNKGKLTWIEAPRLTNFILSTSVSDDCGEGWQCRQSGFTQSYAVNLGERYRITNLLRSPGLANFTNVDHDLIPPGGSDSVYSTTSKSNGNITYGITGTDDPTKVRWGALGDEPNEAGEQWILFRSPGSIVDEVVVHIEDNEQKNKPAFGQERWWTAASGTVTRDESDFREGFHSISVD